MTDDGDAVQSLHLADLSDIEVLALQQDLDAAGLGASLTVTQRSADDLALHGAMELASIALAITPAALPILAAYLLRFAPPQPVKRVIVTENIATRVKTTETITYSRLTPIADLLKRLAKVFETES